MSETTAATTVGIDPDTRHDRLDEVTVIDVRAPGGFETTHIPSADNLPLDALDEHVDRIHDLEGGMLAWQASDGPVVQDVIRWDPERQIRLAAGLIVLASILVSIVWPPARFVAGALGAGLIVASVTNTCAMGVLLSKLPYNRPQAA